MRAKLTTSFLLFFSLNIFSQHQAVFPGQSGDELLTNLVAEYKAIPLDQSAARDILFAEIYNVNDSLTGVYSGSTIYLDPSLDPTQAAFESPAHINTEHTFPKSFGADGIGEGDMHHLYPTRADVNADRGNLPFGEVPDAQADSWYYLSQETSSIPSSNIDLYSERGNGLFEPPEAHKGNVARAMMYFYTMYKPQADAADPTFFASQTEALCQWHFLDPVDNAEWSRTWGIAEYQQGKPNPFVLDCTLPERTYCQAFSPTCTPVGTEEKVRRENFAIAKIQPNPMREGASFHYSLHEPGEVKLEIFNLHGTKMDAVEIGEQAAGEHQFFWRKNERINPGAYISRMTFEANGTVFIGSEKIVILP